MAAGEHAGEVSSSQLGGTSMDLSKFEALTLNDHTPHTLESPDRVDSCVLDSTIVKLSVTEKNTSSEIPQSEEKIAQNARKRMAEEAFRRYIESKDNDLREHEYVFDEIVHQCFYVEHHFEAFYHFNFTIKIKKRGLADWTSAVYFGEVRWIRGVKHYACYPLDPDENGECYACQKEGMLHELRHPLGVFPSEVDQPIIGYCEYSDSDDSDDEVHPTTGLLSESEDDMS